MLKQTNLVYDYSLFLNADYSQNPLSCIGYQVRELKDIHDKFGGFPKTYCAENTTIYQLWWTHDQIDYADIGSQLGMEVITVSSVLQPPGQFTAVHRDTFYQINQRYPERREPKVRANIYLENYKFGQFIQYQNNDVWETSTNWRQGEGFMWDSNILHLSVNAGLENKYTLQVSGFLL